MGFETRCMFKWLYASIQGQTKYRSTGPPQPNQTVRWSATWCWRHPHVTAHKMLCTAAQICLRLTSLLISVPEKRITSALAYVPISSISTLHKLDRNATQALSACVFMCCLLAFVAWHIIVIFRPALEEAVLLATLHLPRWPKAHLLECNCVTLRHQHLPVFLSCGNLRCNPMVFVLWSYIMKLNE